ncbi:MAG: T9SS type A sorting domain-containing protein [Candidatus Sabulitectum sp.]|nr:T9SS type A sorting domain-containing protein [Candidatus Sabulitectum sp.]
MKRKSGLICLGFFLLILKGSSFADHTRKTDSNICPDIQYNSSISSSIYGNTTNMAMWDILLYFETTASSQSGIATDGNFIYTSSFSTELFRKFEMDGTFVEDFSIPGISTCNCLTFDGTYFYGAKGNLSDGIFVMDLENHTLINTIPVSAPSIIAIGHISFDPELDSGNGGFWIGYWHELAAVNMSGNEVIADLWTGGATFGCSGSAYDSITDPANPRLFLFRRTGSSDREIYSFDINSQTFSGVLHIATDIPGPSGGSTNSISAGLDIFVNNNGKSVLLGMIDCFPGNEMVFEYEILDAFVYTNDIGVQSLVSPVTGNDLTSSEDVTVSILNNGTVTQSNFNVQYTIDDGTGPLGPFSQTVTQAISPGDAVNFTFNEKADLSSADTEYTITVTSSLTGDENQQNDALIKMVENTSGTYGSASGGSSSSQEYICNVVMGSVSNTSGADHYANYSTDPGLYIYLESGVSSQLTITLANPYSANNGAVWVDWNLDYDFSSDERVFLSTFGQGPYTTNITAPDSAVVNENLRMRLRLDYNNPDPQPYGFTSFGEVEDYAIIVGSAGICDDENDASTPVAGYLSIYPNPACGTAMISFALSESEEARIDIFDLNGRKIQTVYQSDMASQHQIQLDRDHMPSGVYICVLKSTSVEISRKLILL